MLSAPLLRHILHGCSVPWFVDNSDSLSIMEQSQQGASCSCISFIIPCLWLCGVSYALCLLPSLLQCCLEVSLQLSLFLGTLLNGALHV